MRSPSPSISHLPWSSVAVTALPADKELSCRDRAVIGQKGALGSLSPSLLLLSEHEIKAVSDYMAGLH